MVSLEKLLLAILLILVAAYGYQIFFRSSSWCVSPMETEGFVPLLPADTGASSHLLDYYPNLDSTGQLGDKGASDLWTKYPIFQVGSYDQMTNNIRYPVNPDVGQCRPESMCNVLYGDRVTPVEVERPPVTGKVRVGFYTTDTPAFY